MKKSYTHYFIRSFPVTGLFAGYIWFFGVIRNEEAKNVRRETLRDNTINKIKKMDEETKIVNVEEYKKVYKLFGDIY